MAGTLKVKIQEDIILDNQDYGSKRVLEISSIDEIYKRIVTCPANAETTVVHFKQVAGAAGGATKFDGALNIQDVKYVRVTNLDSSNNLTLSLQAEVGEDDTGADVSASVLLEAGKSFMMGSGHDGIGVLDANANIVTDLVDLDSLVVQPGSNAISVEVFVASA